MDFVTHATNNESGVDTIRILHQTIVSLRTALEKSRGEIIELKSKKWSNNDVEHTIRNLSIENHILRQKVVKKELEEENTHSNSKEKLQVDVDNHLSKVECKKKKVKSNNKDKTQIKKLLPKKQKLVKDTEDNTVHISLQNNVPKQLKSQRNSRAQLSKSRIVCFSNTFEDDKHISTTNSLHINALNQPDTTKFNFSNSNFKIQSSATEKIIPETNLNNTKNKIPVKHKKNIQFAEEPIDNVLISKQGSISEFITKEHKNQIALYTECITKTETLLKNVQPKLSRQFGKCNVDIDHKLKSKLSNVKDKRNKSVILDESPPLTEKCSEKKEIFNISKQVCLEIKTENIANLDENVAKNKKTNEENIVGSSQSELQELENKFKDDTVISNLNDEKIKCNAVTAVDITEIDKALELNPPKENLQSTVTSSGIEDIKNKNNINLEEVIKKDDKQNSIERDIDDTETSSINGIDDVSNTKHKNIEISVKIYKKIRKPIEIDIQTRKKNRKKKNKKIKMNDKSQNTSFDKEYNGTNSNQLQCAETSTDNASADNIVGTILQNDVEQEVDDIELIFTTDDTKESDFKEELVPIDTYAETQLLQCPLSDYEEKLSIETSDRELEDDVFNDNFENENQENSNFQSQTYDFRRDNSQIYNSKSDNSINHEEKSLKSYYSYQDSSFENKSLEKDESFDRFEEKIRIIETDISKIGIQDVDYNLGRRNTCPNPIQYRPIIHREALGRGSRKSRPIVAHANVIRKESGVQTDISALPGSSWRSESSLGHKVKVGENFTTLPSKFPHPGSRLKLSEKTVEARRVLLSDIGFTSMVPELSRSADHLCPPTTRGPVVSSYGQFLRTTDLYSPAYTSQKFVWTTTTPSDGSHSQSRYSSQYPLSSPPAPTRRCSAPVSPSKRTTVMKNAPSKVRFANASLPELRGDWTATVDSGESTDSLVEEAEHFLRRSIDCLAPCRDVCFRSDNVKITGVRRASAPEPSRDNVPPQGWQPFLPRIPRDLHLDYWVKVISPEGRVRGGRVRYVGPLINQPEAFVGVQLSTPDGVSDGTYNARRYFNCEPYHGLFVPFKKIIMGWRP